MALKPWKSSSSNSSSSSGRPSTSSSSFALGASSLRVSLGDSSLSKSPWRAAGAPPGGRGGEGERGGDGGRWGARATGRARGEWGGFGGGEGEPGRATEAAGGAHSTSGSSLAGSRTGGTASFGPPSSRMFSLSVTLSGTPLSSLIRLALGVWCRSLGTILEGSRHLSGSASSTRGQLGNSRQGPALASGGGASCGGEASSHPSCEEPDASGNLLGGTTAREGAPAGLEDSKEVSGQGGVSAVRPACSFLSPLGSGLRAGEGDFNTGSVLGFSSGEKEKGRITKAEPRQTERTLPPPHSPPRPTSCSSPRYTSLPTHDGGTHRDPPPPIHFDLREPHV